MNDSTGKEIYEADIVRTSDNDDELAVVEWDDEDLRFTKSGVKPLDSSMGI